VVLYRTYAGKLFDLEAGGAYAAFKAGDGTSLARHARTAMAILGDIQDVLAVCPSYSINATIAEACSVKGHNSLLPETIRQNCLNQRYTTNDVYEQFGGDYIPRTEAYFDLLAGKIAKGESTVAFKELEEPFKKIDETYRMQGWSAPAQEGDPVERVAKRFAQDLVDWKREGACLEFPKTGRLSMGTSHRPDVVRDDRSEKAK
jgi:hypothetical protein